MAKSTIKKHVTVFIALLTTIGFVYIYDPFLSLNKTHPPIVDYNRGYFRINPETILTLKSMGDESIFLPEFRPLDDISYTGPALYEKTIQWHQSDYLGIASALNQHVWQDNLDNWSLYRMVFDLKCQDNPIGFESSGITYYKSVFADGRLRYTTRDMVMFPKYLSVIWGGGSQYPHPLFGWKGIDLSKQKITAEDALKMAEENGGRKMRLSVQNKCNISITLLRESYDGWLVHYSYNGYSDFEIRINYITGEVERKDN